MCPAAVREARSCWVGLGQQEQGMAVLGALAGQGEPPCLVLQLPHLPVLHSHAHSQQEGQPLK